MSIAIVNTSTVVSDLQGQIITGGLNMVLPQFCKDWGLSAYTAIYIPLKQTTTIPIKIFLMDVSDQQDALAYHDLSNNVPYGKAFAKTVLQYGVMLYSANPSVPTFAQAVAHEVFELLIDPLCNGWWDIGDGKTLFAREVCDPVESNAVTVNYQVSAASSAYNIKTKKTVVTPAVFQRVGLSDWILPAWSDPQNTTGPFSHNNTLKSPFILDKGGYAIQITNGQDGQIFAMKHGEFVTEDQKARYSAKMRVSKRRI